MAQFLAGTGFGSDLFSRVRRAVVPGAAATVGRGAPADRALYQAVSLLLDYPDTALLERLPLIRELVGERGEVARPLLDCSTTRVHDSTKVQQEHVETFDQPLLPLPDLLPLRRHPPSRGALVDFGGLQGGRAELTAAELPDHLGVLLEFGAQHDLDRCRELLVRNRPGWNCSGSPGRPGLGHRRPRRPGHAPADRRRRPRRRPPPARGPPDEEVGPEAFTSSYLESGPDHDRRDLPSILLWVVLPHVCLAIFVVGHIWRYCYDKSGPPARASCTSRGCWAGQPAVPLRHPVCDRRPHHRPAHSNRIEAIGISQNAYHWLAVVIGAIAGLARSARPSHLPPPDGRAGVLGHHHQRQGDVRLPAATIVPDTTPSSATSWPTTTTGRSCRLVPPDLLPAARPSLMVDAPTFKLHAIVASCCSRSGRSPAWCTSSPRPSATCGGRTWSTAHGRRPSSVTARTAAAGCARTWAT